VLVIGRKKLLFLPKSENPVTIAITEFSMARQLTPNTNVKALRDGLLLVVKVEV